jgi:hypothetical protein
MGQVEEFAFTGRHVLALEPGKAVGGGRFVAMAPAVEEHFDPHVGPVAQACVKSGVPGNGPVASGRE